MCTACVSLVCICIKRIKVANTHMQDKFLLEIMMEIGPSSLDRHKTLMRLHIECRRYWMEKKG